MSITHQHVPVKSLLASFISQALITLNWSSTIYPTIDYTRERCHGDFACNIALLLAKKLGKNPKEIAEAIIAHIPHHTTIEKIAIAGAGFINFFITPTAFNPLLAAIMQKQQNYGHTTIGAGKRVHLEFVSANPTGPLHVGHGRGAAYGAAVADLLTAIGYDVHREYYVNDAGRQMDILAVSVWARYAALAGEAIGFPENGYQGGYIYAIADKLYQQQQQRLYRSITLPQSDDVEIAMDLFIASVKEQLGETVFQSIVTLALDTILTDIRADLLALGIHYQAWFCEKQLWQQNVAPQALAQLQQAGHLYEKDGALWFRSTTFGDDKDRVVRRDNGLYTYFASDIAYHWLKFTQNYDQVIDVLGADHHGYIPRLRAIIRAFAFPLASFHVPLVQFAVLYRGKEKVAMSTRSGEFVTLRDLRQEIGNDATRFFYVMRKADQHLDFDLELAKAQSNDNPVYYIQYAHARIASVFRQLAEKQLTWQVTTNLSLLNYDLEKQLLLLLERYQETLTQSALQYAPHLLAYYLRELADLFHRYYHAVVFLTAAEDLRAARLTLLTAIRQLLANGLQLLGVSAPDRMSRH